MEAGHHQMQVNSLPAHPCAHGSSTLGPDEAGRSFSLAPGLNLNKTRFVIGLS
jgi:hypothetical protein